MSRLCYNCQLARHWECVDVGCICWTCCLEEKEQDPIPYLPVQV